MAIASYGNYNIADQADFVFCVPGTDPHFAESLAVLPMQLLAYYTAVAGARMWTSQETLQKASPWNE